MAITHSVVSVQPDSGDEVSSNAWNANHVIGAETITDVEVAGANKDGVAGTASMRTLGAGAQQAAAGNHTHAGTYQPADVDLDAVAGLATTGLIERTGAGAATTRTVGVAAAGDVPDRAAADTRYSQLGHTHAQADVTNLVSDLAAKADAALTIFATAPLRIDGIDEATLEADRTISVNDATTVAKGVVELATNGESAPNVVVQGNDARLSDARTPLAHGHTEADVALAGSEVLVGAAAPGAAAELALTTVLDWLGSTAGSIAIRKTAGTWGILIPVAAGKVLTDNGVGADPSWEDAPGGGGGLSHPQVMARASYGA